MSTPPLPAPPFETVAILGVGLIGGSLAAAVKRHRVARRVVGIGRDAQRLEAARQQGLIDVTATDLTEGVREAQLLVVCTPVDRIVADVRQTVRSMPAGSLITDAGSVKGEICRELSDLTHGPVTFVGSHPLAGSEKQGFEHASATLFAQRLCLLTPLPSTPSAPLRQLHAFWQAVGMQTCELTPADHDRALARTSHLPHAVAAALALTLLPEHSRFAASGFRDTTRIAAGDPTLWTAIFQQNAAAVIAAISDLEAELGAFRQSLADGDLTSLKKRLEQAKTIRDALHQPPPPP